MTKDYYAILEVDESCSEQELKCAYRKLARKWHPDVAGNTSKAVEKFKEINEAYEILSNKVKRADYDRMNRFYNYSSTKKETNNTTEPDFKNTKTQDKKPEEKNTKDKKSFNWENFLSKYKEYANKYQNLNKQEIPKYGNAKRGKDITTDVEISISEAINGTAKVINMLNTHVCQKCGGRKFVNGNICTHCNGKGDTSDYKRFTVKIPAGIKDNSKIRLSGEGEKGTNGGKNGDLYITVHIKSPLDYKTEENNIIKTLTIEPYEAVLGGHVNVKTPNGNISVKISPNTQNGQKIRLSGCGINLDGKIGDMILTVEIRIPKNITNEEINLYKRLKELSEHNVR